MENSTKLGLGGHSFIEGLGNDPRASFEEQCAIVAACLDNGISLIDTTYYQERRALGEVLRRLGRCYEARITAWNFFSQAGKEEMLTGFSEYGPASLAVQLAELQTDFLDLLVIHRTDDEESLHRQIRLARTWQKSGRVREIGLGMARRDDLDRLPSDHPITCVLAPYNAFHPQAEGLFREAHTRGFKTVAMSPFVRSWNLDKIGGDHSAAAALLLRWVTSQPIVDTVFVSMHRAEWVGANRAAEGQGELNVDEAARVQEWVGSD